jgi:hypothetical protein
VEEAEKALTTRTGCRNARAPADLHASVTALAVIRSTPAPRASLEKAKKMLDWKPLVSFPAGNEDGPKTV